MIATVHYTAPEQGVRYDMIDGTHIVKVGAENTGGQYEMFEVTSERARFLAVTARNAVTFAESDS